jgi:hypothetical protein
MGDELDVPADQSRGFGFANNTLRMHWLLRRLTRERFDLAKRSQVLTAACETAPLGWLVDFASSAYEDYHPRDGKKPEAEQNCLTTAADSERLRAKAIERTRSAATSGELLGHQQVPYLLYRWRDADGGTGVKKWTEEQLKRDDAVIILAKAFTSYSWSQGLGLDGLGDMVAKRNTRASVGGLEAIVDKARFLARVEELAASDTLSDTDAETIREFLEAWKRHDKNPRA